MDRIRREKMNILRKAFKIFDGSSWNEYHLKTDSKQVIHTKADGTDTTVEEQLLALNSTCICSRADNVTRTVSLPSGTNMTADRKSTRLNSSHPSSSRMPSSA